MARRIRFDGPAVAHHVMVRGLDGAPVFSDADDSQDLVDRLARLLPECGARCYAWSILSNHAHLVLQTHAGTLSRVMRRLNTGFAVRWNRLRGRRGYVFMDRFRSRIVAGDSDLVGLIRYVHRNPIEAGLVGSVAALEAYPWCGHAALLGVRAPLPFEAVAEALSLFDDDPARARAELRAWMSRDDGVAIDESAGAAAAPTPLVMAPAPHGASGGDFAALIRAALTRYGLAPHELGSGSKSPRIARARAVVCYVAVVGLGESGRVVAEALGVSRAAVSAALDRGRRAALEDGFWLDPRSGVPSGRI
jgi:REP element-mobilizing transposase RayT